MTELFFYQCLSVFLYLCSGALTYFFMDEITQTTEGRSVVDEVLGNEPVDEKTISAMVKTSILLVGIFWPVFVVWLIVSDESVK